MHLSLMQIWNLVKYEKWHRCEGHLGDRCAHEQYLCIYWILATKRSIAQKSGSLCNQWDHIVWEKESTDRQKPMMYTHLCPTSQAVSGPGHVWGGPLPVTVFDHTFCDILTHIMKINLKFVFTRISLTGPCVKLLPGNTWSATLLNLCICTLLDSFLKTLVIVILL